MNLRPSVPAIIAWSYALFALIVFALTPFGEYTVLVLSYSYWPASIPVYAYILPHLEEIIPSATFYHFPNSQFPLAYILDGSFSLILGTSWYYLVARGAILLFEHKQRKVTGI
jgi:hypothetical protein